MDSACDGQRRRFLVRGVLAIAGGALGAASLAGCASGRQAGASKLPDPVWPDPGEGVRQLASPSRRPAVRTPTPRQAETLDLPTGVIPRGAWSGGSPNYRNMARMQPIRRITVHHDGMSPFTSTSKAAAAARIEAIRRAHASQPGWGDIGYHYVIDPAGRVWEGRSTSWQGAHVRDQNPGNIGVCVLGNYERQTPNEAQLRAVERFVAQQMRRHRIGVRGVHTHRELAATACPGRNLQPRLVAMRSGVGPLAMV